MMEHMMNLAEGDYQNDNTAFQNIDSLAQKSFQWKQNKD